MLKRLLLRRIDASAAEYDYDTSHMLRRVNYFCRSRQLFLPVVAKLKDPFRPRTSLGWQRCSDVAHPRVGVLLF